MPPVESPSLEVQALPEPPLPPVESPSLEVQALPEPPLPPVESPSLEVQALPEPPLPPDESPSFEMQIFPALSSPPPPGAGDSSGDAIELDQSQEEESTWIEDPVKRMSNQLAAARAAAEKPKLPVAADPRVGEVRERLNNKLMLSAELDSFCTSFFPHVAQKFVPGMSRAEKTELLLGLVAANEINKRLREWSSRLELHQEVVSSVVARGGSEPTGGEAGAGRSGKSPPRVGESFSQTVSEDSASFKPATNAVQVAVGLVLANRYFLTSEVGPGPVAVVWSAYDRIKDEQVGLKLIYGPPAENPAILEVFWRSAQQMSALSHPAIVGVLNKPREESEIHYVVVEFLPGGNLRQWVQGGKLTRGQILRVLQRLGAGLQYAHERRVLHRNIKPSNILFDGTGHARLSDFNLVWPAEAPGTSESRSDRLIYMAPEEQLGGGSGDPRADVYSLGMCALYALYGQELPSRVVQDRASFIDSLDATPALKAVLRRATAASPAERFATAAEFCRALEFDSPALPGISVRNSVNIPPAKSDRSGPNELHAALPPTSPRPAPPLLSTPSVLPPPPIPNAPYAAASPPLPATQAATPPPLPTYQPELVVPPGPLSPTFDARPPLRESGDLPPLFGPNSRTAAENRLDADRGQGMSAVAMASINGTDATPAFGRPRTRRWQPYAFAGIALLAVAGTGLGYFWGTKKVASNTAETSMPPGGERNNLGDQPLAISRPLRVEPLLPLAPTPPAKPLDEKSEADKRPPEKPVAPPPVAVAQTAKTPAHPPAKVGAAEHPVTAAKPAALAMTAPAKPLAKVESAGLSKATLPPPKAASPAQMAKPAPAALALTPAKPAAKPVAPSVVAQNAKAKESPRAQPPKMAVPPTLHGKSIAAVAPKKAAAPMQKAAAPMQKAAAPPRPLANSSSSQGPSPEAEAAISAAQRAFVSGQHQQAISMAMQVTTRGGPDSLKAWRFVGGAACSVRSAQLATNAYNHLRDPEHRRLLVDLCRRNGLQFNGSQFSSQDE